ncbi:MAG: hypothetical protein ACI9MC_002441 [Kiritimatiellia bacterium]
MKEWLPRLLWTPAIVATLFVLGLLVITVAMRLTYPYDLEWMEGGVLVHAWRIQHGMPIYGAPNLDFISFVYPPGYPVLLAALGTALGLAPSVGRAISVSASIFAAGTIAWIVGRHSQSAHRWLVGGLVGAIFLGSWPHSGGFMDLVRPDALALALLLLSTALALERKPALIVAAGAALFAAFVVKQHAAAWGVPLVVLIGWRSGWRDALRFALPSAIAGLIFTVALSVWTDAHYWNYLFVIPRTHPMVAVRGWPGVAWEWGAAFPVAAPFIALWALENSSRGLTRRTRWLLCAAAGVLAVVTALLLSQSGTGSSWSNIGEWLGTAQPASRGIQARNAAVSAIGTGAIALLVGSFFIGLCSGAWRRWRWSGTVAVFVVTASVCAIMRAHQGGYTNVLMPLHALTATLFGLAIADLLARRVLSRPVLITALALCLCGQSLSQASALVSVNHTEIDWPWDRWAPSQQDRAVGDRLVARLAEVQGPVWSPYAPWLPVLAGHRPSSHLIALWDVDTTRHPTGPYQDARATYLRAASEKHWGAVLGAQRRLGYGIEDNYPHVQRIYALPGTFRVPSGWPVRPIVLRTPEAPRGLPLAPSGR